jgi:polysaccharide pyruvyl transferase WcaK-like protein/SAM-dependent methyltransferase
MNVLCIGFYGWGNVGDEAMARSWDRYLVRPFEQASIRYATEAAWDHLTRVNAEDPFYAADRHVLSVHDTEAMAHFDVVIVGGGHLSPLYGAPLVLRARELRRAKLIARIGASVRDDFLQAGPKAVTLGKAALEMFDVVSVRDRLALDAFAAIGMAPHLGADPAIEFPTTDPTDLGLAAPYAVVVVREVRDHDIARQIELVHAVLGAGRAGIEQYVSRIVLLPFCEPDARFLRTHNISFPGVEVLDAYKTPERAAAVVARASCLISIGRLHPLVFAVSNRVPCIAISYRDKHAEALRHSSGTTYNKMVGFMDAAGLGHRLIDWDTPVGVINEHIGGALRAMDQDRQVMDINGGFLKKRMLESLIPVWQAMGADHGLGLERGLKKGEFKVDDYDDTYMHGARVYKQGNSFHVWDPPRCDWEGWNTITALLLGAVSPPPTSVLDIGCGRGFFIRRLIERGVKAQGLECSEAARADAHPLAKDVIRVARIQDIADKYDAVTAFDVMEHLYEEDVPDFVGHMKRLARRYIIMNICASPEGGPTRTIRRGQSIPDDLEWLAVSGHVTIRHKSWWRAVFEDSVWKADDTLMNIWINRLGFPAWEAHNILIMRRT